MKVRRHHPLPAALAQLRCYTLPGLAALLMLLLMLLHFIFFEVVTSAFPPVADLPSPAALF